MKKLIVLALILVSISLVSAQIYIFYDANKDYKERIVEQEMYEEDEIYHTKTNITYVDYDNPERLSTHEYRYGYSYRTSEEYLERYKTKYANQIIIINEEELEKPEDSNPKTIEKYFESLGKSVEVKCYDSPPKDKFIYRKCPE